VRHHRVSTPPPLCDVLLRRRAVAVSAISVAAPPLCDVRLRGRAVAASAIFVAAAEAPASGTSARTAACSLAACSLAL